MTTPIRFLLATGVLPLALALLPDARSATICYAIELDFVNPSGSNALGQTVSGPAVWRVTGAFGAFDVTVVDGNGKPGGFFDGFGIGSTQGVDYGMNTKDTLTFTIGNFTGPLASQTGGGDGVVLIDSLDLGRFGGGENDSGIYSDSNGSSFTFSQGGAGGTLDHAWPGTNGDTHTLSTPLSNNPSNTPSLSSFPAISASGVNVGQGGSFTFQSTGGNPRWDLESIGFKIIVPEPSRAGLLTLGIAALILCRSRPTT